MANEHPFQHLFETLGRTPISHADSVNRKAYEVLSDILTVAVEKPGRCILLRAPRAGHGKTHLLARIQHQLGATHQFVPLNASFGSRIDASSVIDDTLRCLVKQLPASGGLSVLDLVTRRLFAFALQPLVGSGEVPCQDREGALSALRLRPVETFDFHHPNAVTAHWARENFEVLGQRLSLELAQRGGLPVREVAFWVDILFRFASAPLDHSGRVSGLAEVVHQGSGGEMERLEALLGMVSQLTRVVLVADDLEGFSSDESAALKFAAFLGTLRQSVERLDVIISLNQDIWESAFLPRLSGGLADRLSEVVVELEPLKEAEMAALLDSRVPGLGAKVLERIDVASSGKHARGLIRAAGMAWLKATAMDEARAEEPVPVTLPTPAVFQPPARLADPEPQPVVEETAGEVETPAFTFSNEAPVESETDAEWPSPAFSPAPVVLLEPENSGEEAFDAEAASAEASVSETEAASSPPSPVEVGGLAPQVEQTASDLSAPPEPEANPEEDTLEGSLPPQETEKIQAVDSPFQAMIADPESPFQFSPPAPELNSPEPHESQAAQPEFSAPDVSASARNFQTPAVNYQEPPQNVPIQEPVQEFHPPQPAFQPPAESPFQAAPQEFAPAAVVPQFQPEPEPISPPVESPFQAAPREFVPAAVVPQFQPEPEPTSPPVGTPVEEPAPPPSDTDRVDDLLRQFRERYGRGSL